MPLTGNTLVVSGDGLVVVDAVLPECAIEGGLLVSVDRATFWMSRAAADTGDITGSVKAGG